MTDYRSLCVELFQHLSDWYAVVVSAGVGSNGLPVTKELLNRARTTLAASNTMTEPPLELIEHWVKDAVDMVCEGVIDAETIPYHVAFQAAEWGYNQAKQ